MSAFPLPPAHHYLTLKTAAFGVPVFRMGALHHAPAVMLSWCPPRPSSARLAAKLINAVQVWPHQPWAGPTKPWPVSCSAPLCSSASFHIGHFAWLGCKVWCAEGTGGSRKRCIGTGCAQKAWSVRIRAYRSGRVCAGSIWSTWVAIFPCFS